MTDLNVMMREQARLGLQTQLDAAVTNGDMEAARKVAADIAKLEVSAAPKAPPFTGQDVYAVLDTKAPWYGVDPKKSAKAEEFGKSMKMAKFASAEAFADAIIKAVDEEFKPATAAVENDDAIDDGIAGDDGEKDKTVVAGSKPRKTDGPGESDALGRGTVRRTGPWVKLFDAPAEVQKEIKRSADKFVSSNATKEHRETFVKNALESHYAAAQRAKGKK